MTFADRLLVAEKVTAWSSVPVLFERIANSPRFGSVDFSSLRHAVTGGASLGRDLGPRTDGDEGISHAEIRPRTISGKILKRELRREYSTVPSSATLLRD